MMSLPIISVVVPVFNEEVCLKRHRAQYEALKNNGVEIIVVDGGSTDSSRDLVVQMGLVLLCSEPGRAKQMNRGAKAATGSTILFLHADSVLPENFLQLVTKMTRMPWGFFCVALSNPHRVYKLVAMGINFRSRVFRVATGDQGIFVDAKIFQRQKGYCELPLMEDITFSRQLKKIHKPYIIRDPMVTSSRRWESRGVVRTVLLMWMIQLAFKVGVSAETLVKWYK